MTRLRFAALFLACILLFSACEEGISEEPSITASVGEYIPPETATPETDEVTEALTQPPETEPDVTDPPRDIKGMTASEILALSTDLCARYNTFTRTSRTETEMEIGGEITEKSSESTLMVKDGNAVFRRNGAEEYYLVDSFLCFGSSVGKCRIGGMSIASFLELFSDQLPIGSFEEGEVEHGGGGIVLKFDQLSAQGALYLRETLGLSDAAILEIEKSNFTVKTDSNGHMSSATVELSLTVLSGGEALMKLKINSVIKQNSIVGILDLDPPSISDYVLFPDLETIAYYENAALQVTEFKSNRDAFEFTDTRKTAIESDSYSFIQNSTADYAYASRIGLSIDKRFDTADGEVHTLLTHFNNRRAFSQIDGESIFVDTTLNKKNLVFTMFRPFDTVLYSLSDCRAVEITKDGRIELTLKDSAIKEIARQILMSSGIPADDLNITKVTRAVTYIKLDESGRLSSVGYELSLRLTTDGKTYTLNQTAEVKVTSHNSAKVKVIFIEVDEDEE